MKAGENKESGKCFGKQQISLQRFLFYVSLGKARYQTGCNLTFKANSVDNLQIWEHASWSVQCYWELALHRSGTCLEEMNCQENLLHFGSLDFNEHVVARFAR